MNFQILPSSFQVCKTKLSSLNQTIFNIYFFLSLLHSADEYTLELVREFCLDKMTKDGEEDSSVTIDNGDDSMISTSRRRKKVVTFASLAELAEIQALAASEPDSLSSEIGKPASVDEEIKLKALQDPSLFLNMPLEDYDATNDNVSKFLGSKL